MKFKIRTAMRTVTAFLAILLLAASSVAPITAQHSKSETKSEDPFTEDPLFTRSLNDLLGISSDSSGEGRNYLGRIYHHGLDHEGALEAGPYSSHALYGTYPTLPMLHFNRVDGLFLGIRRERMQWHADNRLLGIPNIRPHGMLGYAFASGRWQYSLGAERYVGDRRHVMVGAEYHNATTTDDYWRVGLNETSLTSFAGGYDHMDYYSQQGWGAYVLFRTNRLFEGGVAFNDDRYSSLQRSTTWAFFGSGGRYRPNPPVDRIGGTAVDTVDISALTFSASYNPKRLVLAPRFTFSARAEVEVADAGISSSDYGYTRWLAELFSFYNFERGGVLKHRLRMGGITGGAPLMKQFQLGGVGSLRALPFKSLSTGAGGNQMLLSNLEVQFGSPDFGSGGWIDFEDIYMSLFLDSGWLTRSDRMSRGGGPFDGFSDFRAGDLYHNAGLGLGSNSVRCELAWDLENTSRSPVFWIRFNPTF